jgi:hypothetical protein
LDHISFLREKIPPLERCDRLYILFPLTLRFYTTHPPKERGFIYVNVTMLTFRVCNIS